MKAENCDRYGAEVRGEKLSYGVICRRYVCDACGGGLVHKMAWNEAEDRSEEFVACGRCGGTEIISQSQYDRQRSDAMEFKYTEKEMGMPLKDVTDTGRLKVLGRIRLGWQEPNASGRGEHAVAADHFVLTDASVLAEVFGDEPRSLPIRFPFSSFDRNILAYHRVWAGGQKKGSGICICQGDGEKVLSSLPFKASHNRETGRVSVRRAPGPRTVSYGKAAVPFLWGDHSFAVGDMVPCPGRAHDLYPHCEACKPNILLNIRIRDERVARFGYWQVGTTSINNYKHFVSVWDSLTDGGTVPIPMNQVPFVLSIEPGATLYQNKKDQMWASREAFFLNLTLDPTVAQLVEAATERRFVAMLQGRPLEMPRLMAAPAETEVYEPEELFPDDLDKEETDLPFDDPPVEEAEFAPEAPPPSAVEHVDAPNGLTHKNFARKAVALDGYDNIGQVKVAMLSLHGPQWERTTEWSPTGAWVELQDYAASPKE